MANKVTTALNEVLVATYELMAFTHQAHWNVEGEGFFELHKALGGQYEELLGAADELAERLLALGQYADISKMVVASCDPKAIVGEVMEYNESCLKVVKNALDIATVDNDLATQNILIERVTWHEKTLWQLRAYLAEED